MSDQRHAARGPADEELVARLASGDRQALQPLFERHREFVFRVALGACGEREDAVEIVQEVFLALFRQAPRIDPRRGRLTTWLYRVARNQCTDRRRRAARPVADPDPPREQLSPDQVLLDEERRELLTRAVARLPARPREVFVLRVGLGLSVEETAEMIGIRAGAVRTALHTARTLLRKGLGRKERLGDDARRHTVRT